MVFVHLKLKGMQGNAKFESYYICKHAFQIWKHGVFAWAVGEFEIHYEFWTHLVDFKLVLFSPTYDFEIDLELTQISNLTIGD